MTILAKHTVPSPLGPILLAASPDGLRGAWFNEQAHGPAASLVAQWRSEPELPVLQAAAKAAIPEAAPRSSNRIST